jgi:hypothetical protein
MTPHLCQFTSWRVGDLTYMLPCLPPSCIPPMTAGDNKDCKYYTVQGGDTLASIASSLGLALLDMQSANPDTVSLQPNDYVKLPGWWVLAHGCCAVLRCCACLCVVCCDAWRVVSRGLFEFVCCTQICVVWHIHAAATD